MADLQDLLKAIQAQAPAIKVGFHKFLGFLDSLSNEVSDRWRDYFLRKILLAKGALCDGQRRAPESS
jgi:hypothetical protein